MNMDILKFEIAEDGDTVEKIEDNKKDCGIFLRNPFYYQLFKNELYVFADHFVEYKRQ